MTQAAFKPYGAVQKAWASKAPRVLVDGPAGTGKTRGLLEKAFVAAAKYNRARILLCRKTRASMTETVLVTWEDKVLPPGSSIKMGAARRTRSVYSFPNGSEIVIAGLDNPERIMSSEYDLIICFEATEISEDDVELLDTRLRNGVMPYQQLILDCNPAGPNHHLKRRADRGWFERLPSRHEDNPVLWNGSDWTEAGRLYLSRLDALTGHRRSRLLEGHWAAAEGLVYSEFDPSKHVIKTMPPGWETWRKVRSIDLGFTNPFVCQWWAVDPDGRMYLYREIYHSSRLVEDHAKQIVRLSAGENIEASAADHDLEDRMTLERHGVQTNPARKDIVSGIQAVQARLKIQPDGKPRLFVLDSATVETDTKLIDTKQPTSTLSEFDAYIYPPGRDNKNAKETPVDAFNHGMDAMRYAVMLVDNVEYASVSFTPATVATATLRPNLDHTWVSARSSRIHRPGDF